MRLDESTCSFLRMIQSSNCFMPLLKRFKYFNKCAWDKIGNYATDKRNGQTVVGRDQKVLMLHVYLLGSSSMLVF